MTEPLYLERGVGYGPLLWGPAFAVVGSLVELLVGDRPHWFMWVLVAFGLLVLTSVWVYARRRFLTVRVTGEELWQGQQRQPIADIADIPDATDNTDVGTLTGARVLGGGWSAPHKYQEVPLRLADGSVVVAWARDAEALRTALRTAMRHCDT